MKRSIFASAASAVVAVGIVSVPLASPAGGQARAARSPAPKGLSNAVFVQTNDTSGNQILAYSRGTDGSINLVHAYDTGGKGFHENPGPAGGPDTLASQGGLVYDAGSHRLLIAVNGGSGTITTFAVSGDVLSDRHVYSAGSEPVSVAIHGNDVYVVDAGGTGAVTGFTAGSQTLTPLKGSTRSLALPRSAKVPQALDTPAQVSFTPDGQQLVVTTKKAGNDIDVFGVKATGLLSAKPVVDPATDPVPFGFMFDPQGHLVVTEAGGLALSVYSLNKSGTLSHLSTVVDGQQAPCWVVRIGVYYYVVNAGSADISTYQVSAGGVATLMATNSGIATTTDAGPIDEAASSNGRYLYVETGGAGTVDEFGVNGDGTLTSFGTITGLGGTGIEGIVAA